MKRYSAPLLAALLALAALPAQAAVEMVITEPQHSIGYLPLYLASAKGYFQEEGIKLTVVTTESGGAHTNAVLSGQAFGFIGGPEHNAFAKLKGAELRAVANVVNRGNVYLVAAKGLEPKDQDWPAYMKGKTIGTGLFSGTPNSIIRYLLGTWHLDVKRDVTLIESASTAAVLATIKAGQVQIATANEPVITQGIRGGIWGEPIYSIPKEMGPYAYSTLNVRLDSIQKDPKQVASFVRAVIRGLKAMYADPKEAATLARKEFPTMPVEDLLATLDRSFADEMWSADGIVEPAAWNTAQAVVRQAGILKADVPYDQIFDMSFVKTVLSQQ
jgi:NitT/TauT family transport system substrate-binding protein